jgi:hypothetical protein
LSDEKKLSATTLAASQKEACPMSNRHAGRGRLRVAEKIPRDASAPRSWERARVAI